MGRIHPVHAKNHVKTAKFMMFSLPDKNTLIGFLGDFSKNGHF